METLEFYTLYTVLLVPVYIDWYTSRLQSKSNWENLPFSFESLNKTATPFLPLSFLLHIISSLVCTVPTLQSTHLLTFLTLINLSLSRSSLISLTFWDVNDVGLPQCCSSITLSYQFSYRECHLCNAVIFIAASPYALTNISIVFLIFFSIENTKFNHCSLFDAHFDAPCIIKMAANAQITADVYMTSLSSCQDLAPYSANFFKRYWIRRKW